MSEIILDMGIEGLKLKKLQGKKLYNAGQFKDILGSIAELERIIEILGRRGVDFEEYTSKMDTKPLALESDAEAGRETE